jgi:hypothetical protein
MKARNVRRRKPRWTLRGRRNAMLVAGGLPHDHRRTTKRKLKK